MYISLKHHTRWDFCSAPYIYNAYMFRLYSLIWWNSWKLLHALYCVRGAVWKSYPMLPFLPYITSQWNPKLTGVCACQMSLFRILQVMNVNVDVDALHSLRKQLTFCDFAAVSLRNDWRNSILMMCQYSDLGWATDWLYYERNLLQPIRSTSQIWVVMRHQCGISEVFAQKSFHRKTSGVVIKCQLFSLALFYSVQKKFTSCKWRAGFWVMPPPTTSPDKFSKTARSMHLLLTGFRRSKMPRFRIMSIIVLEVVYNIILEEEG